MSKLEELKNLRDKFNIILEGLENYPTTAPNVLVANHNCLMDIFLLPSIIPEDMISLISSRLIYKNEPERKNMVEKYLTAMPIEAHGGKVYSDICIDQATDILSNGYNVGIFPEGAYIRENDVYRGRTGATRILYSSRQKGTKANLVPVAIDIDKENLDLDSYSLEGNDLKISILKPIDYDSCYEKYIESEQIEEKNEMLHKPIDIALSEIATTLNRPYHNEYIELFPKKSIILENGEVVPVLEAQSDEYISRYSRELEIRKQKILKK